jgi:hypothetical protein
MLGEPCGDGFARRVALDPHRLEGASDPPGTATLDDDLRPCERASRARVVERAFTLEAREGGVDGFRVAASPAQPIAQLPRRQLAPPEGREGVGIRVRRRPLAHATSVRPRGSLSAGVPARASESASSPRVAASACIRASARRPAHACARAYCPKRMTSGIVLLTAAAWSISSREMSAVVDTPCTFSLNSSLLDA